MDWKPIDTAPFDRDLELAVIDGEGKHTLTFPCRRIVGGWFSFTTYCPRTGGLGPPSLSIRNFVIGVTHLLARTDGCRRAAIRSLLGEERTWRGHRKSVASDLNGHRPATDVAVAKSPSAPIKALV